MRSAMGLVSFCVSSIIFVMASTSSVVRSPSLWWKKKKRRKKDVEKRLKDEKQSNEIIDNLPQQKAIVNIFG